MVIRHDLGGQPGKSAANTNISERTYRYEFFSSICAPLEPITRQRVSTHCVALTCSLIHRLLKRSAALDILCMEITRL